MWFDVIFSLKSQVYSLNNWRVRIRVMEAIMSRVLIVMNLINVLLFISE